MKFIQELGFYPRFLILHCIDLVSPTLTSKPMSLLLATCVPKFEVATLYQALFEYIESSLFNTIIMLVRVALPQFAGHIN